MRIRPGLNLVRALLTLAALSPLSFVLPSIVWVLVLSVLPIVVLSIGEYRALGKMFRGVGVARRQPGIVGRDAPFAVELEIANRGDQEIVGLVRDCLPNVVIPDYQALPIRIAPGEIATLKAALRIPQRGRYELGPLWIRLSGPWRLVEAQNTFDCQASLKVMPETYVSPDALSKEQGAQLMMLDKIRRARQSGVGTEFESLAEFRQGDDPRRIDWRSTARMGHPIVRRYQVERHRDVMILVDCGRLMGTKTATGSKLDCAIDASLMLAEVALRHGDRCGISFFDDRVRGYRTPLSGISSLPTIAEGVYDLQSQWRESDFGAMFAELQLRQTRRSLIVLLSDIVDLETTLRFRTSLARLAKKHVFLFAALRTPRLDEVINSEVSSQLDGARQAVAFSLLKQREKALHSLRHGGIHVLNVEPSELTIPLINEFIELRCQNLL